MNGDGWVVGGRGGGSLASYKPFGRAVYSVFPSSDFRHWYQELDASSSPPALSLPFHPLPPLLPLFHPRRTNTVGRWLVKAGIFARIFGFLFTNRIVLWFCGGVSSGQLRLIRKEGNVYR